MMKWNRWLLLPLCLVLLFLSGCFFSEGEDLFALPEPPADYLYLQEQLADVLSSGAEYAAPLAGSSTQPVQVIDLDGDGTEEALAFFRVSGSEQPLQLYIFRQTDGVYETEAVISGNASSFRSVTCADLTGNGICEILVGYQMSPNVYQLSVYSLTDDGPVETLNASYVKYTLLDIEPDGTTDLVVFYTEAVDQPPSARLYCHTGPNSIALHSAALLSAGIGTLNSVSTGLLGDGAPALYASSSFENNGQITDILAMRDGVLTNITLDRELGFSADTLRYHSAGVTDIDSDGVLEVPQPVAMPAYSASDDTEPEVFWLLNWRRYLLDGSSEPVCTTFHNYQEGWFLLVPSSWVDHVTVTRSEIVAGETAYSFGQWNGPDTPPTTFLVIYRLTGADRTNRSHLGSRFVLYTQSDVIYAAELTAPEIAAAFQITPENLSDRFCRIITDWSHTDS